MVAMLVYLNLYIIIHPLEHAIPQNPALGSAIQGVMAAPIILHTALVKTGSAAIRANCYKGTKPEVSKYLEQML